MTSREILSPDERDIGSALADFDVYGYVEMARSHGRSALPSAQRDEICSLYERICAFRAGRSVISRGLDDTLEITARALEAEWFLAHEPRPRYRSYANIGVLNWCLGTSRRTPYQAIWARCATAVALLLRDLLTFEVNSLAGIETRGTVSFDAEVARTRVRDLSALLASFSGADATVSLTPLSDSVPRCWEDYVGKQGQVLALLHLTAFPQTIEHDEYLFLRAIHISEACFWGILTTALAAVEHLKRNDCVTAAKCLGVALPFAELLMPLFMVVKTMGAERFARFRDATGDASAVQSRTYQLMQIVLTGANAATIGIIADVDELQDLLFYDQPQYASLAQLLRRLDDKSHAALDHNVEALSEALLRWRKLHRGIARIYLAGIDEGTGGTTGASYLKRTVEDRIEDAASSHARMTQANADPVRAPWIERRMLQGPLALHRPAQPVLTARN